MNHQPEGSNAICPSRNQFAVLVGWCAVPFGWEGNGNRLLGLGVGSLCCLIGYKVWPPSSRETWRNDPATAKQRSFADDLGIRYPKNISKGDLSDLVTEEAGQ